jgi:Domain of unknown function (DUF6538)
MPRHPRLQKRGSRYFLRMKVPADLRSTVGKREVREALGASEPREALKRVRQASAETDAMFEALRGKVAATEAALVPARQQSIWIELYAKNSMRWGFRLKHISEADEHDSGEILEVLREDEATLRSCTR